MRRDSREVAFKIIFESLFNAESSDQEYVETLKEKDRELANQIITFYMQNKEEIQSKVDLYLKDYKLERVFKVDQALLYLAVSEIEGVKTPPAVVVNEIIEISKNYSTDKSPKFLNGVLSSYIKDLKA